MKRIKQRLLSLAMTGALLLGFTLPEAFTASAKSSNESSASEAQTAASKKNSKKQSKDKTTDAQAEEKSSKTKDKTDAKAESTEDKAKSGKSEKSEEKADSGKSEASEAKKDSAQSKSSEKKTKSSNSEVSLTLSISKPSGLSASGGAWQVDPGKVSALTLSWKCKGEVDSFKISVSGGVYSASTEKKSAKIPVSDLSEGKYTATVKAIRDGKTVAKDKLSFQIIASSVEEASEEPASESIGNGDKVESATQKAQPGDGLSVEDEGTIEALQDSGVVETDTEGLEIPEDSPAEDAESEPETTPAKDVQDATGEKNTEQAQNAALEQSSDEVLEVSFEHPGKQGQDAIQYQFTGIVLDVLEEQPLAQAKDATHDQSTDEARDASEQQPEKKKNDAIEEVLVEATNDATVEQSAGEESLDLSEPDIQIPQENLTGVSSAVEELISDVTIDASDEAEILFAEADEALELSEPSDETDLTDGDGISISSNAEDEKKKTATDITLSIKGAEGVSVMDGAVHINPAQAKSVILVWSFGGTCDEYAVNVSGDVYDGTTKKSQLKLPVKNLPSGQYTVTVAAKKDGKALSSARTTFIVDAADSEGETAGLAVTIASPQGLLITEGVYQVDPAQAEALTVAWQYGDECDAYDVSISGDVYSGRTEEANVTFPLSNLSAGTYTVTVVAIRDGESVAQASLSFNLPSQDEKPEEDPGKDGKQGDQPQGGGQRSGGQKRSAAQSSDGQEADQGFHVTPGEPLISTHTSGNRDMRLYGAVALTLDAASPMDVLTLGDTLLDIRLSDGSLFTASIETDALALVPQGEAQAWLLNGYALKTLARSGVKNLRLTLNDMTVEFPTLPELSGSNYGKLCAAGQTSRDYSYTVTSNGCTVTVAGQTYQLTAEGELA